MQILGKGPRNLAQGRQIDGGNVERSMFHLPSSFV
jgi:hypothetical protein